MSANAGKVSAFVGIKIVKGTKVQSNQTQNSAKGPASKELAYCPSPRRRGGNSHPQGAGGPQGPPGLVTLADIA